MPNDFPSAPVDASQRIVQLEEENAKLRACLKTFMRYAILAGSSFVSIWGFSLFAGTFLYPEIRKYNPYVSGVGVFLGALLNMFMVFSSDSLTIVKKERKFFPWREIIGWFLVPIVISTLTVFLIWITSAKN